MCGFAYTWFPLLLQNISMVVAKKHTEKALLELMITREINSPFLLDCSCVTPAPTSAFTSTATPATSYAPTRSPIPARPTLDQLPPQLHPPCQPC